MPCEDSWAQQPIRSGTRDTFQFVVVERADAGCGQAAYMRRQPKRTMIAARPTEKHIDLRRFTSLVPQLTETNNGRNEGAFPTGSFGAVYGRLSVGKGFL